MSIENLKKEATRLGKREQVEFMHFLVDLLAKKTSPKLVDDWKRGNSLNEETLAIQSSNRRHFNDINGI